MKILFKVPSYIDEDKIRKYLKKESIINGTCVIIDEQRMEGIISIHDLKAFCLESYSLAEQDDRFFLCKTKNGTWVGRSVRYWVETHHDKLGFSERDLMKEIYTKAKK